MKQIFDSISKIGFVPLLSLERAADAVPLANALAAGGVPVAEVTFRTDAALCCMEKIAAGAPGVLLGAGTVHTAAQAEAAAKAGARFIVTPGFAPAVVSWCQEHEIEVLPGVSTPSDIEQALTFGLKLLKFFPAEAYGGVKTLKALAGPYGDIRFVPTGGVSEKNMDDYLVLPNVAAIGGSFLTPDALVREGKWEEIADLCRWLTARRRDLRGRS